MARTLWSPFDSPRSEFASAERVDAEVIAEEHRAVTEFPHLKEILDGLPVALLVLNAERQIVCANEMALAPTGGACALGLRHGEALHCIHCSENAAGCGTSRSCASCGAVQAVLESQQRGTKSSREAQITTEKDGRRYSYEFLVSASPLRFKELGTFTLVSLTDISHERRRHALESIFYHDVLNTAGGLQKFIELLIDEPDPEEIRRALAFLQIAAGDLVNEIAGQRDVALAERGELSVTRLSFDGGTLLGELLEEFRHNSLSEGKDLRIEVSAATVRIVSDPLILKRVVRNLLKNACEASCPGEAITLGCATEDEWACLWVHNQGCIAEDARRQIFGRFYSTKGRNRGLGTYSVRLLTERYLGGSVALESSVAQGTTFKISIPQQ